MFRPVPTLLTMFREEPVVTYIRRFAGCSHGGAGDEVEVHHRGETEVHADLLVVLRPPGEQHQRQCPPLGVPHQRHLCGGGGQHQRPRPSSLRSAAPQSSAIVWINTSTVVRTSMRSALAPSFHTRLLVSAVGLKNVVDGGWQILQGHLIGAESPVLRVGG